MKEKYEVKEFKEIPGKGIQGNINLLKMLYTFSNPVCIKAALDILGLPGGHLRRPYEEFTGKGRDELERLMGEMGVIDKYGVR